MKKQSKNKQQLIESLHGKPAATNTDRQTLHDFWNVGYAYKNHLWLAGFIVISGVALNTVLPYLIGMILAGLTVPGKSLDGLFVGVVIAAVIGVVTNRIGFGSILQWQAKVMRDLQEKTLYTMLSRSLGFHSNHVSGKLVSDASDYPSAYGQISSNVFINLLPFAANVILGTLLVMLHSVALGLIILAMSAMVIIWAWWQSRIRLHLRLERHVAGKDVIAQLADNITNVATVKSSAQESSELAQHRKLASKLLGMRIRDWTNVAKDGSNRIGALLLFQIAFIAYLIQAVHANPALLAIGIFSFSYTINLGNKLFQINDMIRAVEEALLQAMPMTEFINESVEIVDRSSEKLVLKQGQIMLKDLGFSYQEESYQTKVFHNLQLVIEPGSRVGLVGPSGGGKSTLMRLLLRFEEPQEGAVLIDNQDISMVTQASLRSFIAYVPQEPLLFHRSIRENIAYGKPDITHTELEEAARKAYALDFIQSMPHGFDTVVGERGVKLSGGQRQRIVIARAILRDAPILLLDEATSALDSESEKLIQSALKNLMKNRTVIVIAHRLSTINELDRIIVVDEGEILEDGNHKQLLEKKGLYARLWAHQSGGFIEE